MSLPASVHSLPSGAAAEPLAAFLAATRAAIEAGDFASLVLSKPRHASGQPRAVRIRLIALKGVPALSFVATHATRDATRNLALDDGIAEIAALLRPGHSPAFAHATLHATDGDAQLLVSKKGKATLCRHRGIQTDRAESDRAEADRGPAGSGDVALAAHDRERQRRLPLDLPFLVELGLTDASHRLVPSMARKWRQIDKFLEVLDHALDALPAVGGGAQAAPIRVVDYGAGKGYLTFAVHEHLRRRFGVAPDVTGVELRADLVEPAAIDVMIALHACDTATDHAIDLGVRAGAAVLVCSPCCHKELRPQLARPRLLSGLLRHGIHVGQEAEMVTDSMRALLLETCGYEAQVFEFVSLEHTSKNKMILAKRRSAGGDRAQRARGELADLKSFYGIREQRLETLLLGRAAASGAADAQACQTP